jgi:small subunit ribosomal protein S6
MLDSGLEESKRESLAGEARKLIESSGELKHADDWGVRKMAYEIEQRNEADYRFFRFAGGNDLLGQLDHTLKIADGALRFRIFKVDPDAPTAAPPAATHHAPPRHRPETPAAAPSEEAPAEAPAMEAESAPPAEEPAVEAPAEPAAAAEEAVSESAPEQEQSPQPEEEPAAEVSDDAETTPEPEPPADGDAESDAQ